MNPETMIQHLKNKLLAIEAKKKVAAERGNIGLYDTFNSEYIDTQVTLNLLLKATEELKIYRQEELKNKLVDYILEELPNLAFYFRSESINAAVADSVEKAFKRLIDEHFKEFVVSMEG